MRLGGAAGRSRRFLGRLVRAVALLARDGRIPRHLRWGAAFGVAPVPGPFDEVALLLVGGALWLFHRDRLRHAWREAGAERPVVAPGETPAMRDG